MQLRILTGDELRQALPMRDAIDAAKRAYAQFSAGQTEMPLRSRIAVRKHGTHPTLASGTEPSQASGSKARQASGSEAGQAIGGEPSQASGSEAGQATGTVLFMPALLRKSDDLAVKIVSVFPDNAALDLPIIHALVTVIDPENGQPLALLEGGSLTAIRTGAGSGAATDLLARRDASRLGIFGSGVQARTQLEAVCAIRQIDSIWVFSPSRTHAESFARELSGSDAFSGEIQVAGSPSEVVRQTDILCTATTSAMPVFSGAELRPGTHINAIGSYTPQMQEVDLATIRRSLLVVDSREAVLAETGDLIIPIEHGEITAAHIHAELGEVLNGSRSGRTADDQITAFKSVGLAVQDAAAAGSALRRAAELGLGTVVEL